VELKEARLVDLSSVASLRVSTFYPEMKTVASFHHRILEKIKNRVTNKGAICLIAYRKSGHHHPLHHHQFPGRKETHLMGNILGTAEFSAHDFKNTSMENIGSWRKLYVADLAVRQIGLNYLMLSFLPPMCTPCVSN